MELFRLHAYSVVPQRTSEFEVLPDGGATRITAELRSTLVENTESARFSDQPSVDFAVDPSTRTNETREAILAFAFGEPSQVRAAALQLAKRLAAATDRRSTSCLFVPTAFQDEDRRRVILWIFPRDEAFRLRSEAGGPVIEILQNVFSQKSKHRKAAMFEGRNIRTDFLTGRVLDHQANSVSRDIADFWIGRFLQCTLAIRGDAGTRMLAKAIRKTYDSYNTAEDQEQMYTAVMAMRRSPHKTISLSSFADRYLEGEAKETFLAAAPNNESREALFSFNRDVFDSVLHFRVFQLESGVFVSSPLSEIGNTVKIREGQTRVLSCEGNIVDEKMRTHHG